MSKVPWSLVGYKGYTKEEAHFLCECFRKSAPHIPERSTVLALESELKHLPDPPSAIEETVIEETVSESPIKSKMKKRTNLKTVGRTLPELTVDDYPSPWCKVTKDGKLIRYEDANGRSIPQSLWPERSS